MIALQIAHLQDLYGQDGVHRPWILEDVVRHQQPRTTILPLFLPKDLKAVIVGGILSHFWSGNHLSIGFSKVLPQLTLDASNSRAIHDVIKSENISKVPCCAENC